MILSDQLSKSTLNWLIGWTVWPIIAYWISCLTGFGMVVFFPITLTIAQWYVLKNKTGNRHPAYWFFLIAIYGAVFYSTPRLAVGIKESIGYSNAVLEFYTIQCAAELLLFSMFTTWRLGWYSVGNLLAYAVWYTAFKLNEGHEPQTTGDLWLYMIIPAIAVVTYAMTGYGLIKATETTGE